ncbi:Zinc finger, C2H2 type [Aphelenchoides bicaudatus]|nr:Zinc finger, C2H2 type [Aphelenchoides bicaudatus]
MLNYDSQFYAPVYPAWTASTPLLPTTSTDYVPQLANPYYAPYNVSSSTFPTYPPPTLDVQQFGAGYPSFVPNDTCLNVYPTSNLKSDVSVNDALAQNYPPVLDTSLTASATSNFSNKRNVKREPSNSPPNEMICMWETDASGGVCGRQFLDQRKFVDHLNNEHVGALDGIRHICLWRDCSRSLREFKAKYKLINHIRVKSHFVVRIRNARSGEKPFKCRGCHKTFANSSDRKKHMHVHSKHKPYICVHCNKKYTHPSSLRKHHKQMHPDQPSISMSKNEEFEESSDSGNASITPNLSDQNTYVPNTMPHQQTLLANAPLFQPQNNHQTPLIPSKDFQRPDVFTCFPTTFAPQNTYYQC